ncbi:hypothetical protein BU17DRAFT_75884 [Hysterangium stoloniferum]|nr:hypothetical protein BU17DRAFT_75884 [Hysterangium stoloniferum]
MSSESHVWFVTGSSQGLGKLLVETILAHGDRVVATARQPSSLATLQAKYPASQLLVQRLDVTSATDIAEAFEATESQFSRLDVVVNMAGYGLVGEIEAIPEEEARKMMETHFWGPVNITKAAIKFFRKINPVGHGGRIFNVSSVSGYVANPTLAYYTATKFALEGFTEAFIKEMPEKWNIKGCILELGGFPTAWRDNSIVIPQHPAYDDPSFPTNRFRAAKATSKYMGDPNRCAEAMYNLASSSDLPLRLQLGSDSFYLVTAQAKKTLKEQQQWARVSHSTNVDDYDRGVMSFLESMGG